MKLIEATEVALAAGITAAQPGGRLGWLADRLIYTVGMAHEDVAALDLQQAVDIWGKHMSGQP